MCFDVLLKRALPGLTLLLLGSQFVNGGSPGNQQDGQPAPVTSCPDGLYSSEKGYLRGPVKECAVEVTVLGQDGETDRFSHTDRYDLNGDVYQFFEGGRWTSITYDGRGRELAESQDGDPKSEETYSYDDKGRLTSIKGSDETETFEYDDLGRKTRTTKLIVAYSPEEARSICWGVALSGIENSDLSALPPDHGLVKTSFNEHDQAVESQVFNADGDLVSRLVFQYDSKGRVTEFTDYQRALDFFGSATGGVVAKPQPSGEPMGKLTQQIFYTYDDQGHVSRVEMTGYGDLAGEHSVTTKTYNERGDLAEETETTFGNPARPHPFEGPQSHVSRLSYEYDFFGNWIERTAVSLAGANQPERTTSITRRLITYY